MYPPFVLMSGVLLAENLFVPLVLGTVLALLRARGSPGGVAWWAAAGALASAASLTGTNGAVLLVLVLTLAGWAWLRGPLPARVPAVALAAAVLVLVPWTVRNMAVFDSLVPFSTQTGFVLAGEYNLSAAADGPVQAAWRLPQFEPEYRDLFFRPGVDEAELDRRLRAAPRPCSRRITPATRSRRCASTSCARWNREARQPSALCRTPSATARGTGGCCG